MISTNPQIAVLLLAYGSPERLEDVEAFLTHVRGGRAAPPELLREVRERYAAIGGKSPLLEMTLRQGHALEKELDRESPGSARVFVGMRHWKPTIREAVEQIAREGLTRVTALCMTPFYSQMSTGAYYTQLQQAVEAQDSGSPWRKGLALRKIGHWFDHPGFIRALADTLDESLKRERLSDDGTPAVLFTAHSLPTALAERGDAYAGQFTQLCDRLAEKSGLQAGEWFACYQSAGAKDGRWLGPSLEDVLRRLASAGRKSALVAPVGFLCDHVEILYDIDIEARELAARLGMRLSRTPSLNDDPDFIAALADIVRSQTRTV